MDTFHARLHAIVLEADGIATFEFRRADGADLPPFTAGAHIDVHIRPACVRQYSLCNDPAERHRYVVAVLREEIGRGGSRAMHEDLRIGQSLTVSAPRNFFPLVPEARRHLLLAGGIGVTPMMAMTAELESRHGEYFLHYCTRSRERTAFRERVEALASRAAIHHDGGDPARGLDLVSLLREHEPGTHLYYCGPAGFMRAVADAASHWPAGSVHAEHFTAPVANAATAMPAANSPFRIRLARSALDLEVPADKSIVDVLRENDVFIETSCTQGYCGTCLTRYLDGEPEHRDTVLDDDDRREFVLVCCARARTPTLELDL